MKRLGDNKHGHETRKEGDSQGVLRQLGREERLDVLHQGGDESLFSKRPSPES